MKRKHRKTLELIFRKPVSGNVKWQEVVAILNAYGATIDENRAGSRVHIELRNKDLLQHRPHPSPSMDKGAVAALRKFLALCDIRP
ncbi:MAG: type II toxin-antitoxin system HicA family toxin [Deltaproteobacteria bacterium]|nr:type II toxin-antitoxin system HicA family toxin [Deltaproteobacteria bacterium]